jgi:transposase-like protein/IS1 family transposase
VTCHNCQSICNRFGKHRNGLQRYRCSQCRKTFTEDHTRPLAEMRLPVDKALAILQLMLEGMSIRAIERFTGVHRDTILRLMNAAAQKARNVLDTKVKNINPNFVQVDEMWGFVHTRHPNLHDGDPSEWGSTMLWLAIDSETKLLISYHVGTRSGVNAHAFISDLHKRTNGRYQITSDQYNGYVGAVREYFGRDVDFGQLHKVYGRIRSDNWYGTGQVLGAVPRVKIGRPDWNRISTSHVERTNLSVRMHLRRFTRLTNAHSKTLANMKDAVALYVAFYNFCRVNQALKKTPAMEAGIADHAWTLQELLTILG